MRTPSLGLNPSDGAVVSRVRHTPRASKPMECIPMIKTKAKSANRKGSGRNNKKPSTQVVKTTNALTLPGKVSQTELTLPNNMTEAEWQAVGNQLSNAGGSLMWWVGDWWAYGEDHKYGSRKQFVENWENGYAYSTCMQAGSVARHVPTFNRLKVLPWPYHRAVMKLTHPQQKRALAWAEKKKYADGLTEREFKAYIKNDLEQNDGGAGDDKPTPGADNTDALEKLLTELHDDRERATARKKKIKSLVTKLDKGDIYTVDLAVGDIWRVWQDTLDMLEPLTEPTAAA